jgi:hypothetical protein
MRREVNAYGSGQPEHRPVTIQRLFARCLDEAGMPTIAIRSTRGAEGLVTWRAPFATRELPDSSNIHIRIRLGRARIQFRVSGVGFLASATRIDGIGALEFRSLTIILNEDKIVWQVSAYERIITIEDFPNSASLPEFHLRLSARGRVGSK